MPASSTHSLNPSLMLPMVIPVAISGSESSTPTWKVMTSAERISFVPMKMLTLRNRAWTRASLVKCGERVMWMNQTRTKTKILSLNL
ncbi:hypothetical protein HPB48_006333 [Haemaphysalis longicornis]|uniref:Uncharacterized protein n=1 Tax=Haemaphysalis longicornis TaxID=44386 RepID=A0A9J6FDS9_HAELO|nr:hypothetical protein HPB48_006333 [Haemaphysalis longicornis]